MLYPHTLDECTTSDDNIMSILASMNLSYLAATPEVCHVPPGCVFAAPERLSLAFSVCRGWITCGGGMRSSRLVCGARIATNGCLYYACARRRTAATGHLALAVPPAAVRAHGRSHIWCARGVCSGSGLGELHVVLRSP